MGTRAAAFTAKIHNLQHYNARIKHNLVPLPSGDDIANTLKYFSQTLLSVLKDVPSISLDMLRSPEKDPTRTALFPSLDYKSLFNALVEMVEAVPLIQHGAHALGHTILHTLSCLVPFLEHDLMDTLPYLVASSMTLFPISLQKDIIDMLCNHLLPFTFRDYRKVSDESYASMSTAAVLMMIFQYTDCSAYHCQVLECLMSLKKDIVKDLLCVIAHGTAKARCHAVELLFQYLPTLNPALLDRKGIGNKVNGWLLDSLCTLTCLVLFPTFSPCSVSPSLMPPGSGHTGWKPLSCQRENCCNTSVNEAVKMCFDHSVCIASGEHPPPLYICEMCAEEVEQENGTENIVDILLPMDKVSVTCEDPDCKANDKSAVATCFSIECANRNNHRPIRYCAQCVVSYHNEEQGMDHMLHTTIPSPWNMDPETQSYMVEAVVRLLREAEPLNEKLNDPCTGQEDGEESREVTVVEERQLLSRYGIWLLVGLCTPNDNTPVESLGRLLSMLFQWFHYTACLPDDQAGNALERLKAEYIHGWLMEVVKSHFEVFVSCLLPHPVDYAKVGGHWESWPSYAVQIKEGFKRLLCLVPYDIITLEVWEYIMPYWMDAFRHEAVENEFSELKILLSKVLDPDLSPLGFNTKQMYKFLSMRFESTSVPVQEQALYWLQILTMLEVPIPLELLYEMFMNGVANMTSPQDEGSEPQICNLIPPPTQDHRATTLLTHPSRNFRLQTHLVDLPEDENAMQESSDYKSDSDIHLPCYILMLDILIKQLELQEVPLHKGLEQKDAQSVLLLLRDLVKAPWVGIHTCTEPLEGIQCIFCEVCAIFFQLSLILVEYFSPVMEVTMADIPGEMPANQLKSDQPILFEESELQMKSDQRVIETDLLSLSSHKEDTLSMHGIQNSINEEQDDSVFLGHISPIQTATVQECMAQLDTVTIIPTEKVMTAMAREVMLTEDDVAGAKCTVASAILLDENDQAVSQTSEDASFWHTSEGKFKFAVEELPPQLQLFYVMIKDLASFEDADVLYHILSCLKVMCLHSEILNKAAHNHRGFLIWCQENHLITSLWKLLQSEFSHIAQLASSLLLHSITLPSGSDMFWKTIEKDFHNEEWRSRYAAVEKVTMIAHFVDGCTVKNSPLLQSALANAFSYLVHCLNDDQPTISQRALLNLETIKTPSLKLFVWCLEVQFDSNIMDRPMIIQTIFQIYNHLSTKRFLTWDFFLNRFDTLFLENQVTLERYGEISYVRDLKNTNVNSEMFLKKLKRAQESLSHTSSTKSLTSSLGGKMPYKRTMSAPSAMISRQDKIDKDKPYERQSSAPVLKRKSSRLVGSTVGALGPSQHFPNSFFTDGHLKDTIQEETHFLNVLHRAMDTEDHDNETLHLLVFLLMQFLSRPDPIQRTDDKVTRSQHIVLRHLNILLGYSQNQGEGRFLLPPHKVRTSSVFSTFLMCMPKVLDYNFAMGNYLLTTYLSILLCCPSSQKYPSEHYPPTYSLWLLDPYCRHSWLQSTLVIMYKYHYDTYPYCKYIQWLVIIVLNTLKAQRHRCKQLHESLLSPLPSRSRDFSTPSADIEHVLERERDISYEIASEDIPKSFTGGAKAKGLSSKLLASDKMDDSFSPEQNQKACKEKNERHQWKSWKSSERSCSSEGEDAEPELEAIPESPKSESSELEQFTSDFVCLPQTIDPVCVQLTCDPLTSSEQVVVTNPWSGMSEEATLVTNSDSLDGKIQSQYELPLDAEVTVIEKSTVEVMEKHIDRKIPGSISLKSDSIECKFLPEVKAEDPVLVSSYFLQSQAQQELFPSLKMQAEAFSEKDNQVLLPIEQKSESHPFQFLRTQRSTDTHMPISKQRSLDVEKKNEIFTIQGVASGSHQGVARSKTDSNILDLPQSEDAKISHSRYPKPKFFMGKKSFLSKQSRKAEMLSSENLTVPIFRPPLERLLPIGLHERERLRRSDTYSLSQPPAMQPMPHQLSLEQYFPHDMSMSRESEDKGVQTGAGDIPFDIPAPERLLPIGPMPSKKDWYTTAVFKATMPISVVGDDRTVAKAEIVASDSVTKVLQLMPKTVQVDAQGKEEAIEKHEKVVVVQEEDESVIDDETENQIAVDNEKLGNVHGKEEIHNSRRVVADKHEMAEAVVEKHEKEKEFVKKNIAKVADQEDLPRFVDVKANLNEELNVSALGVMASENLANKIFDLTSDMAPPMSTFGVFDVCKSVMDMKSSDDTKSGRKLKDNEALDQRNSSSSMELLPNEKAEVLGFTHDSATVQKSLEKAFDEEIKCRLPYRQRKQRKAGLSTLEAQRSFDYQNAGARRIRKVEMGSIASLGLGSKRSSTSQSSNPRSGDDVVAERCTECGSVIEEYSDEEIGLCIVILATFVHREPSMAAPMLPKMLRVVARIAASPSYPWQNECNVHLPGGSVSVARQFLRCTLHQLAPNGVFVQIFQSHTIEAEFYKTMAAALADFTEVNQVTPLLMLLENLNDRKHLHHEIVLHILDNVAIYLDCLPLESNLPPWGAFLQQLDLFLRKFLLTLTPGPCQLGSILQIMLCALKLPVINGAKCILDPFSKILSHAVQHSVIEYKQLSDICHVCYRNMCRDRDKLVLTRTAIFELVQALKFKSSVPDGNLLTLVQFVLDDSGGSLGPNVILEGFPVSFESQSMYNTSAGECMRQYLNDTLEFVADVHTLNKVKNMLYGNFTHLNEETLGGHLKAGIAQYLAIEISKGNGRDNRAIGRYLPWLYHPPTTLQQGPKEFIDCVSHIRLLSWLLLGALIHSALMQNNATFVCQPIPLEANSHIAEHIQVILAGFSEQSRVSVLHMSSLFHAFILCQLWTMYCEHMVALNPPGSEQNQVCVLTLTDFWAKVTPGILQLVCHSKVEEHSQLAEMVSLHFLSLMEALQECNSTILARLLPMWTPVLYSFQGQISGNLHVRLQMCVSCQPPTCTREDTASVSTTFLRWLQRLQFKMGQIELQSSTATQFYSL